MSYRYKDSTLIAETASWRGEVIDPDGFVVLEVWNNGDGGGNYYVWHDPDARWEIEDQAIRDFTGEEESKMDYYRSIDVESPMDYWIEELRGKD